MTPIFRVWKIAVAVSTGLILAGCCHIHDGGGVSDPAPTSDVARGAIAEHWFTYYVPPPTQVSAGRPGGAGLPTNQINTGGLLSGSPVLPGCANLRDQILDPACQSPPLTPIVKYQSASLAPGMLDIVNQEFARLKPVLGASINWSVTVGTCSATSPVVLASDSIDPVTHKGVICVSTYLIKGLFASNGALNLAQLQDLFVRAGVNPETYDGHYNGSPPDVTPNDWNAFLSIGSGYYTAYVTGVDYVLMRELARGALLGSGQPTTEDRVGQGIAALSSASGIAADGRPLIATLQGIADIYGYGTWGQETAGDGAGLLQSLRATYP
jgi:hypothetical protein